MRTAVAVLAFASLIGLALAAETPDWAYPVTPKPEPKDNVALKSVPGSSKRYTQAQIDDGFNPPDWYPQDHGPMPPIVAQGRREVNARACALCHLIGNCIHMSFQG